MQQQKDDLQSQIDAQLEKNEQELAALQKDHDDQKQVIEQKKLEDQ